MPKAIGHQKGVPLSPEHKATISKALTGGTRPKWTQERRDLMSRLWKGRNTGDKNPSRRLEVRQKISEVKKGIASLTQRGDKHWNWQGGITPIHQQIRVSLEYKQWRLAVFKKDGYRCLDCGEKTKELHADHIYQFAFYPRLRFDINNGRTLCPDCHKKTPTWGNRNQFLQTLS